MKRKFKMILGVLLIIMLLAGCATTQPGVSVEPKTEAEVKEEAAQPLKVGLVINGNIDDRAFNQSTWEGIQRAGDNFGLETQYLHAGGSSDEDALKAIQNMVDSGFNLIIMPGYTFSSAIHTAQYRWPDTKFVILDSAPRAADADTNDIAENAMGIDFAANEAGFMAGFAAALQLKEGKFCGVHGMEIPPTQLFITGFQQGVIYANENFNTNIKIRNEDFVFVGSWTDHQLGQQTAAQLYDSGCNLIYIAGGPGALNEAKLRGEAGEDIWVVMCDTDRYDDGLLSNGDSVVITSTLKCLDASVYDVIKKLATENKFEGGQLVIYSIIDDGVGIPKVNPNLDDSVQTTVDEIYNKVKSGEIVISREATDCSPWN